MHMPHSEPRAVSRSDLLIVEDPPPQQRWLSTLAQTAFPHASRYAARSLRECMAAISHRSIDLALVDLQLREHSGIAIIDYIARQRPSPLCIVVTTLEDDEHIFASLAAGAQGYLLKSQPMQMLAEQLQQLARGIPALSPPVVRRLIQYFAGPTRLPPAKLEGTLTLSLREKDVLHLIAKGQRICDVARQLHISAHTVCSHIKSIYRKLDVSSRAEAALEAKRMGLV